MKAPKLNWFSSRWITHLFLICFLLGLAPYLQASRFTSGDYLCDNTGGIVTIIKYQGAGNNVTIPDTINDNGLAVPVISIGDNAFSGYSSLTSIVIPHGVTSIGYRAFYNCSRLTSIAIPNGVTSIGNTAFGDCSSLNSISIPNSVIFIGSFAFYHCSSLNSITIPNGVTTIPDYAFSGCTSLSSISIPNSVILIRSYAFYICTSLTSIAIPNGVTSISDNAFSGCSGLTSIEIPNGVTSIGNGAFYNCFSLTNVAIPNSVISIGDGAFNCCKLANVTIPNSVTSIGNGAFYQCFSLTNVMIPNSVTSIGDSAFFGCYGLTNITISNGVTSIGTTAFAGCGGLTSIAIPNSVTSIGRLAFCNCHRLKEVKFKGNAPIISSDAFVNSPATIYYLSNTSGWSSTFAGRPTALWNDGSTSSDPTSTSLSLSIKYSGDYVVLSWPNTATNFVLQYTTNLPSTNWIAVPGFNPAATNYQTVHGLSGNAFYRLVSGTSSGTAEPEIRTLLGVMKNRVEAHDVNGFTALFASDYMHFADNLTIMKENLAEAIPTIRTFDWAVSNIVVNGDFAQVSGTVTITFNNGAPTKVFIEPSQDDNSPGFGWLKKTANGWMIHGNQQKALVNIATSFNESSYDLRMSVDSSLTVTDVKVTGLNISEKNLSYDSTWDSFTGWTTPSAPPPIGSVYNFEVHFADGTKQTLQAAIKSYVTKAPSLVTLAPGIGTARITWSQIMPDIPSAKGYWIWVSDAFGNTWRSDHDSLLTGNAITVDESILGFSLVSGRIYDVCVYLFNESEDFSYSGGSFIMP